MATSVEPTTQGLSEVRKVGSLFTQVGVITVPISIIIIIIIIIIITTTLVTTTTAISLLTVSFTAVHVDLTLL